MVIFHSYVKLPEGIQEVTQHRSSLSHHPMAKSRQGTAIVALRNLATSHAENQQAIAEAGPGISPGL